MPAEIEMPANKALIDRMSFEEKCDWLDELLTSIEADSKFRDTPDWHRQIIKQRLARMKSRPHPGYTIDEAFQKLADRGK
jgi:hypothetical protein